MPKETLTVAMWGHETTAGNNEDTPSNIPGGTTLKATIFDDGNDFDDENTAN